MYRLSYKILDDQSKLFWSVSVIYDARPIFGLFIEDIQSRFLRGKEQKQNVKCIYRLDGNLNLKSSKETYTNWTHQTWFHRYTFPWRWWELYNTHHQAIVSLTQTKISASFCVAAMCSRHNDNTQTNIDWIISRTTYVTLCALMPRTRLDLTRHITQ